MRFNNCAKKTNIVSARQAINIAYLLSLFQLNNFKLRFKYSNCPWALSFIPKMENMKRIMIKKDSKQYKRNKKYKSIITNLK